MNKHRNSTVLILGMAACIGFSGPACADVVTLQPLDLGRWAITKNDQPYHITIDTGGGYTHSPELIMLEPPQPGVYQITGLVPLEEVNSVTATMVEPLQGGGGQFTMDNFQIQHSLTVDNDGNIDLTLGLTARTSGNSTPYEDSVYNGTIDIDIAM